MAEEQSCPGCREEKSCALAKGSQVSLEREKSSKVPPTPVTLLQSHRVAPPHRPSPWGNMWLGKCQGQAQKLWVSMASFWGSYKGRGELCPIPAMQIRSSRAPCSFLLGPFPSLSTLEILDPHQLLSFKGAITPLCSHWYYLLGCALQWWRARGGSAQLTPQPTFGITKGYQGDPKLTI